MNNIEQEIAKRELVERATEQVKRELQKSGVEVDGVDSIELIRLNPKDHSYTFTDAQFAEMLQPALVLWCFTFGGFEDLFTGFIIMFPETIRTHKDPQPNAFGLTCINQYGVCFAPRRLLELGVSFEESLVGDDLAKAIQAMIRSNDALFMQYVSHAAQSLLAAGRADYISRMNDLLAKNGKPPMVVL